LKHSSDLIWAHVKNENLMKTDEKIAEKKGLFLTKEDKVDIIKWMFIFWVGAVGVLSGVMFAMLHAYLK
jgi:hypothetical protein